MERRVLVGRDRGIVVGGDRRDVDVVAGAAGDGVGELVDVSGHVGADVDHGVPIGAVVEGGVVGAVAIAMAV